MNIVDEQKQFADFSQRVRELSDKVVELKSSNALYEQETSLLEGKRSILLAMLEEKERELSSLNEKVREALVAFDSISAQLSGKNQELSEVAKKLAIEIKKEGKIKERNELLEKRNIELENKHEADIREFKQIRENLNGEAAGLNEYAEALELKRDLLNRREEKLDLREQTKLIGKKRGSRG